MKRIAILLLAIALVTGCNTPTYHTIQYEVTGPATTADITYQGNGGTTTQASAAALPWIYYFTAIEGTLVSVSATNLVGGAATVTIYEGTFGHSSASVFESMTSATTATVSGKL